MNSNHFLKIRLQKTGKREIFKSPEGKGWILKPNKLIKSVLTMLFSSSFFVGGAFLTVLALSGLACLIVIWGYDFLEGKKKKNVLGHWKGNTQNKLCLQNKHSRLLFNLKKTCIRCWVTRFLNKRETKNSDHNIYMSNIKLRNEDVSEWLILTCFVSMWGGVPGPMSKIGDWNPVCWLPLEGGPPRADLGSMFGTVGRNTLKFLEGRRLISSELEFVFSGPVGGWMVIRTNLGGKSLLPPVPKCKYKTISLQSKGHTRRPKSK